MRSCAEYLVLNSNILVFDALVPQDFCRGIVIPLLKNRHGDATSLDMYGGITPLSVICKIFELVLLYMFNDFLKTDHLQFGFKKNSSCSHALFAFSESVKYFVNNSSKVYGAFLDASIRVVLSQHRLSFLNR